MQFVLSATCHVCAVCWEISVYMSTDTMVQNFLVYYFCTCSIGTELGYISHLWSG